MNFLYIKALHIIFVVCWFAALFYIVRLFIYCTDAQKTDDVSKPILTKQLLLMQTKLWYIIGWPAMIGTFIFGFVGSITDSLKNSIFILAVFFLLGYIVLSFMKKNEIKY